MPRNLEIEVTPEAYNPKGEEEDVRVYLRKRVPVLKDSKKSILGGINYEQIMNEADREYKPRSLFEKQTGGRFMFIQDEITGARGSRTVPITGREGVEWRSDVSEPVLMTKIQTALSILIDQNPEAVFKALNEKYKNTTAFAHALWKRSWNRGRAKEQLKLFIFDLAKYGWAVGRTYPRKVVREGQILEEVDIDNPENNKYKKTKIVEFDDIYREKLDPWRTWIDDMTNLTDPWSCDDWYFEKDYSYDSFEREFGIYANFDKVSMGSPELETDQQQDQDKSQTTEQRDDIVTVGFYESKNKDLYAIWIPKDDVVLFHSPLPNDQKQLSLWWTYWNERDPRTPYGIGLYEILKNNKVLYDRLSNMSVDQLVMAIYPMLFYSGANQLKGTGDMTISPAKIQQKMPGTTVDQIKIDYDTRGFEGAQLQKDIIDENTGITPTLGGEVTGKTLGEVLIAKDAALRRLNVPLSNIANALETEAMISLSWMNQTYSLPEVLKFADQDELDKFLQETGRQPDQVIQGEEGLTADFFPLLDLSLEEDREGNLVESPEDRFFQIGTNKERGDIDAGTIKWDGIIKVIPQSIVAPSKELERQRKLELFNIVTPIVAQMAEAAAQGLQLVAVALLKPIKQILEVQDEKPENWIPKEMLALADNEEQASVEQKKAVKQMTPGQELFVNPNATENKGRGAVTNPVKDALKNVFK